MIKLEYRDDLTFFFKTVAEKGSILRKTIKDLCQSDCHK